MYGTPMGSPLSPIITDIVMQDLEEASLNKINLKLPFYYRYIDDIIMAAPSDNILQIYHIFNNYYDRLKFTIEYENNHCLNFLDLSLSVIDNKYILIDFIRKPSQRDISLIILATPDAIKLKLLAI